MRIYCVETIYFCCIIMRSYNVYDECGADNRRRSLHEDKEAQLRSAVKEVFAKLSEPTITIETPASFRRSTGYSDSANDYECGGHTAMNAYLAGN